MASDASRVSVPSANGRSDGASLAATDGGAGSLAGRPLLRLVERRQGRLPRAAARRAPPAAVPAALVCMLHEDGRVSRGHGLPLALLEEQAAALGIPLVTRATTWDDYEATFVSLLHELRAQGVRGRRVRRHRPAGAPRLGRGRLRASPASAATCRCGRSRAAGCSTSSSPAAPAPPSSPSTPPGWAPSSSASSSTTHVIARLEAAGADACGEEGEYHTMVTDAPLFSRARPARLGRRRGARRPLRPAAHPVRVASAHVI